MLPALLASLRVPGWGPAVPAPRAGAAGRPRRTPHGRTARTCAAAASPPSSPSPPDQAAHRRRRGSAGGRPVGFDSDAYRGRNVIERAFNRLKNWRAVATRYDKHAAIYRGGLILAAVLLWLPHRETRPSGQRGLRAAGPLRARTPRRSRAAL